MHQTSFPNCCAIQLLIGFGNTHTAGTGSEPYTGQQVDEFLAARSITYGHAQMVVLNSDQHTKLAKVFRKRGFKQVSKFYYCGHGKNIYILLRTTPPNEFKKL